MRFKKDLKLNAKEFTYDSKEVLSLLESVCHHIFLAEEKILHIDDRSIKLQKDRLQRLQEIFSSVGRTKLH
jgi:hypothetical protein